MKDIFIAMMLGVTAGLIDIAPMFRMKVNRFSIMAIFAQWFLLGMVIPFVSWNIQPWLKGLILGELGMLPFMIQLYFRNRKAIPGTAFAAAILGMAIAFGGNYFIGK